MYVYDKNFINKILEISDLVKIINTFLEEDQVSVSETFTCPFCQEKGFVISSFHQRFFCFNCDKTGNIIDFIKIFHKFSFEEAIICLALEHGIPIIKYETNI